MCYETYGTRFKWMTLLFHIVTSVGDGIWKQKEIYIKKKEKTTERTAPLYSIFFSVCHTAIKATNSATQ